MIKKLLTAAATLAFVGMSVAPALADQGGCPNVASDNGASYADDNSAHGLNKQVARGCVVVPPPCDPLTDPTCGPTG